MRNHSQNYCTECVRCLLPREVWADKDLKYKKFEEPKEDPPEDRVKENSVSIEKGQVWEDMDKRRRGRMLTVEDTDGDYIICTTILGKNTKIGRKRFDAGRFRLTHPLGDRT